MIENKQIASLNRLCARAGFEIVLGGWNNGLSASCFACFVPLEWFGFPNTKIHKANLQKEKKKRL